METKKIQKMYKLALVAIVVFNLTLIIGGWIQSFANMALWKHSIVLLALCGALWFTKISLCKPASLKDAIIAILQQISVVGIFAAIGTGITIEEGKDFLPFVAMGEFLWGEFFFLILQEDKKPHILKASIVLLMLLCYAWLSAFIPVLSVIQPVLNVFLYLSFFYFLFGLGYLALGRER